MNNLIPAHSLTTIEGEPRVCDVDLALWLGMNQPLNIRELIARNRDELAAYGGLCSRAINPGPLGGRPGKAYYLNEGQALVICALSRTAKAATVRKALIDVFMAYRSGKLVHVKEHRRRLPNALRRPAARGFDDHLAALRPFARNPEAMLSVMARMMTDIDELRARAGL
jgi:hypothetical protein